MQFLVPHKELMSTHVPQIEDIHEDIQWAKHMLLIN